MKHTLLLASLSLAACTTGAANASLIGADLDALRGVLGPPVAGTCSGDTWALTYLDVAGARVERAVVVMDDVVVSVAPDLCPNIADTDNRFNGAAIGDVVAELGPGELVVTGPCGAMVRFGERELFVAGRVLGPADRVIQSTSSAELR